MFGLSLARAVCLRRLVPGGGRSLQSHITNHVKASPDSAKMLLDRGATCTLAEAHPK